MPKHKKRYVYHNEYHLGDPPPEPKGKVFASAADNRRTSTRQMQHRSQGNNEQTPNKDKTPSYIYGHTLDLDDPHAGIRIMDGRSKRGKPIGGRIRRAPDSDGLTGAETGNWADRIVQDQDGKNREEEVDVFFRR